MFFANPSRTRHAAGLAGAALLLAGAATGPVTLSVQAGSPLDAAARALSAHDIADAKAHGEEPLVLVGSAPLSSRRGAPGALFVQLQSAALCGSAGCDTSVYLPKHGGGWTRVLDAVSGQITVLPTTHGHMHDLLVGRSDRWVWGGRSYHDTIAAPSLSGLKRSVEKHQEAVERNGGTAPPPPR